MHHPNPIRFFRSARRFAVRAVLLTLACCQSVRGEEDVPKPVFDRIDYAKPSNYLVLPSSLGRKARILQVASGLKGDSPEDKLVAISRWIDSNLRYDAQCAYAWRNFDQIVDDGKYGGCADHSIVFGALTRACGIPCVWVKTADIDWIQEFKGNRGKCRSWRGHVFLEVYLRNRWMLLDASQLVLYKDYRATERILPGNRYAYDKGADPYDVVLSVRWELWKKQARAHFLDFDLSRLPLATQEGQQLGDRDGVFVAADAPVYQWIAKRCTDQGYRVRMTFNTDYGRLLPRSRGNYLILTCVGTRIVLDKDYYDPYLPWSPKEIAAGMEKQDQGILRRRLPDGTRIFLVFGKDLDAIHTAIDRLTLDIGPKEGDTSTLPKPSPGAPSR